MRTASSSSSRSADSKESEAALTRHRDGSPARTTPPAPTFTGTTTSYVRLLAEYLQRRHLDTRSAATRRRPPPACSAGLGFRPTYYHRAHARLLARQQGRTCIWATNNGALHGLDSCWGHRRRRSTRWTPRWRPPAATLAFLEGHGLWAPVLLAVVAIGRRGIIQPAALHSLEEALRMLHATSAAAARRMAMRTLRRAFTLCA